MRTAWVWIFLAVVAAGRIGWQLAHGVGPGEAYYWMCAGRLAPAFFDGPAGTAFLLRSLGLVAGGALELARLIWPVMGLVAGWMAWLLARSVYDAKVGWWVLVLLNVSPVFNLHSVEVGPWMPALVLVLAGMMAAQSALEGRGWDWVPAGVLFGLATLFRYEAVLVGLGFAVVLVVRGAGARSVAQGGWGLYLVACQAAALWAPMAWNAGLKWIPVAGGTVKTLWKPMPGGWGREAAAYLEAWTLPLGVVLAAGGVWMVVRAVRKRKVEFPLAACWLAGGWSAYRLFVGRDLSDGVWFAAVPLLVFVVGAARHWKWRHAGWGVVALVAVWGSVDGLRREGTKRGVWAEVAEQMHLATREMPASEGGGFLIAEDAGKAAMLAFFFEATGVEGYPPVFTPDSPALTSQFGLWPSYGDFIESEERIDEFFTEQRGYNPFLGRNALYLGGELPQTIEGAFAEVRAMRTVRLPDGTRLVIWLCLDYKTLPL
jgi:hypothetical protein